MTPQEAYYKALSLGLRIPELEPLIIQDAHWSHYYALDVIEGRFVLGEPFISQDAYYSYWYAKDIIKGKWELGEAAISKNAFYSFFYAKYVIKGKLPDFMHNQMILENDIYTKQYIEFISKNPDSPNNKI